MAKKRHKRVAKRVQGCLVHFEFSRQHGLRVRCSRRLLNQTLIFEQLFDLAAGQYRLNLP